MNSIPLFIADAFATPPHKGNPAAVCLLERMPSDAWLQNVAAEMNLSETAFVLPEGDAWRLRWLTPAVEVDLCGHATLASAHILWESGRLPPHLPARFQTRSGLLTCVRRGDWIEMDFPAKNPQSCEAPPGLFDALRIKAADGNFVGFNKMDYFVTMINDRLVREAIPDFAALKKVNARGVILTAKSSDAQFDFVSRFFAPAAGVDEDPVTGSAHCALAPYWSTQLAKKEITGFQASARGGLVRCRVADDRVVLAGQAFTRVRGEWIESEVS